MSTSNGLIAFEALEERLKGMNNVRIIDVRMESEISNLFGYKVENVPSFELENEIDAWDKEADYVLFCDRGNTSQWAYQLLTFKGFKNVHQIENGVLELNL